MTKFASLSSLAIALLASPAVAAVPCETLSTLSLPNTTITMAQVVAAGQFVAPVAPGRGARAGGRGADANAANPADANANDAAPARRWWRPRWQPLPQSAGFLPDRCNSEALERLRNQDRSLDAAQRMEQQTACRGQWCLGRIDQLQRDGAGPCSRLCNHQHRYGTHGRPGRDVCRSSGEGYRFCISRRSRNECVGERQSARRSMAVARGFPTSRVARRVDARHSPPRNGIPWISTESSEARLQLTRRGFMALRSGLLSRHTVMMPASFR